MSEEPTAPATERAAGRARPSDGLSLADLRDTVRLRQDLTRLEDENRFLREQLAHALSGWRGEQQRTQALAQALKAPPAPEDDAGPVEDAPVPPAPTHLAGETFPAPDPPGFWARLWQSLLD